MSQNLKFRYKSKARLQNPVTIFDDFWRFIRNSSNFTSLDLRAQKELDNVPGHLESSESVLYCYIVFMIHVSNYLATYPTSTDVFRNFQNVTNFDGVDICHQKHVGFREN